MKNKVEKNTQAEQQKEKRILKNESLRNILGSMEYNNICIMGIPEEEKCVQRIENLFEEIITKNFPSLVKEEVAQVQEDQSPKQVGPKEACTKTHHN